MVLLQLGAVEKKRQTAALCKKECRLCSSHSKTMANNKKLIYIAKMCIEHTKKINRSRGETDNG